MSEFWAAIVIIFVVTRVFKLIEKRSVQPRPQEQQSADPIDVRRLEQEIADVRREITEMRDAYTESIVQLQADMRQLRQRLDAASCADASREETADQPERSGARNLTERA